MLPDVERLRDAVQPATARVTTVEPIRPAQPGEDESGCMVARSSQGQRQVRAEGGT